MLLLPPKYVILCQDWMCFVLSLNVITYFKKAGNNGNSGSKILEKKGHIRNAASQIYLKKYVCKLAGSTRKNWLLQKSCIWQCFLPCLLLIIPWILMEAFCLHDKENGYIWCGNIKWLSIIAGQNWLHLAGCWLKY